MKIADRIAAKTAHTGPVTLVVMPASATEREKNSQAYTNSETRYKRIDAPSAADFPEIETARKVAASILGSKGASAQDIAAASVLPFGSGLTACGLHLLIRETD
jgi:hypothetical protein